MYDGSKEMGRAMAYRARAVALQNHVIVPGSERFSTQFSDETPGEFLQLIYGDLLQQVLAVVRRREIHPVDKVMIQFSIVISFGGKP
jgi:hypothetical protein